MANDAVRRIMAEVKEFAALNSHATSFFHAAPLESDLFEWHFTVRGPPDTPFEHGVYHGRILLPAEYPLKAPEIIMLTPNGRFEVGKRICLSVTSHHQETWQPSWGIRTILTALVGFMPSKAEGVGALDYPDADRRGLARKSHMFRCARCGARPVDQLPPREPSPPAPAASAASAPPPPAASDADSAATRPDSAPSAPSAPQPEPAPRDSSAVTQVSESQPLRRPPEDRQPTAPQSDRAHAGPAGPASSSSTVRSDNVDEAPAERAPVHVEEEEAEDEDVITPRDAAPAAVVERIAPAGAYGADTEPLVDSQGDADVRQRDEVKEKELLYIAYAIMVLMLAVVARRVIKMLTE